MMKNEVIQRLPIKNKRSLFDIDKKRYLITPFDAYSLSKLDKYPEFQKKINISLKMVKNYIILLYDINSEMREQISDMGVRKYMAAEVAGFRVSDGKFDEKVEDMIVGSNEAVNDMIVRYITLFNNPDYISYVSAWELYYREVKKSFLDNDSVATQKIRVNIEHLRKTINSLSIGIFRDEDNKNLKQALYKHMESEKLRIRPEYMAIDIENKAINLSVDPYYKENNNES